MQLELAEYQYRRWCQEPCGNRGCTSEISPMIFRHHIGHLSSRVYGILRPLPLGFAKIYMSVYLPLTTLSRIIPATEVPNVTDCRIIYSEPSSSFNMRFV